MQTPASQADSAGKTLTLRHGSRCATLQNVHAEAGTDKTQIVLIAIAVVENKNIFGYRMTVYKGPDTAANLLGQFKATIGALYAANK